MQPNPSALSLKKMPPRRVVNGQRMSRVQEILDKYAFVIPSFHSPPTNPVPFSSVSSSNSSVSYDTLSSAAATNRIPASSSGSESVEFQDEKHFIFICKSLISALFPNEPPKAKLEETRKALNFSMSSKGTGVAVKHFADLAMIQGTLSRDAMPQKKPVNLHRRDVVSLYLARYNVAEDLPAGHPTPPSPPHHANHSIHFPSPVVPDLPRASLLSSSLTLLSAEPPHHDSSLPESPRTARSADDLQLSPGLPEILSELLQTPPPSISQNQQNLFPSATNSVSLSLSRASSSIPQSEGGCSPISDLMRPSAIANSEKVDEESKVHFISGDCAEEGIEKREKENAVEAEPEPNSMTKDSETAASMLGPRAIQMTTPAISSTSPRPTTEQMETKDYSQSASHAPQPGETAPGQAPIQTLAASSTSVKDSAALCSIPVPLVDSSAIAPFPSPRSRSAPASVSSKSPRPSCEPSSSEPRSHRHQSASDVKSLMQRPSVPPSKPQLGGRVSDEKGDRGHRNTTSEKEKAESRDESEADDGDYRWRTTDLEGEDDEKSDNADQSETTDKQRRGKTGDRYRQQEKQKEREKKGQAGQRREIGGAEKRCKLSTDPKRVVKESGPSNSSEEQNEQTQGLSAQRVKAKEQHHKRKQPGIEKRSSGHDHGVARKTAPAAVHQGSSANATNDRSARIFDAKKPTAKLAVESISHDEKSRDVKRKRKAVQRKRKLSENDQALPGFAEDDLEMEALDERRASVNESEDIAAQSSHLSAHHLERKKKKAKGTKEEGEGDVAQQRQVQKAIPAVRQVQKAIPQKAIQEVPPESAQAQGICAFFRHQCRVSSLNPSVDAGVSSSSLLSTPSPTKPPSPQSYSRLFRKIQALVNNTRLFEDLKGAHERIPALLNPKIVGDSHDMAKEAAKIVERITDAESWLDLLGKEALAESELDALAESELDLVPVAHQLSSELIWNPMAKATGESVISLRAWWRAHTGRLNMS